MTSEPRVPPLTIINPESPLIVLQTSNRFGSSDEDYGRGFNRPEEATAHGREAVRAWKETIPDDIKPNCMLQMEVRTHDHEARYAMFQRIFDELQAANIPACIQFADPHDPFVFDPVYVEKLTREYPCIQMYGLTEMRFEHYRTFNVPRYVESPEGHYTRDVIDMAARYGKLVSISLQDLKWMHIGADMLNQPLVDAIMDHKEYIIASNEHIGPRHLQRQTSVMGFWLADMVGHWGVEPQSWWFENARMITPGVFGQREPDNTRLMPPLLYRAMILQGALLGATVFTFEPYWDLFDYDNSHCWREVICPTLREVITSRLIPTRDQVLEKTKVAYQYKNARDINEFHENLRDVDWIGDEGYLAEAAYGLWERYLEHELIPNKSRYFFIPLLPPKAPKEALARFERVITPGTCDSVKAYEALLDQHYPRPSWEGEAWVTSINDHTYVMQTHENLYEHQAYSVDLPKPVRGLTASRSADGVTISWEKDEGASVRYVFRAEGPPSLDMDQRLVFVGRTDDNEFLDGQARPGVTYTYTVTADTVTKERRTGHVNYLDYLVFSEKTSAPAEVITIAPDGACTVGPIPEAEDTRPASQVVHPLFEGADGPNRLIARQIVTRIDEFKKAYDAMDWRRVIELYSSRYQDPNGFHREYAGRAWKWWFQRNQRTCMLRQIRWWDFSEYAETGAVRVKLFSLFRAMRRDDQPFGYGYSGTLRIPRTLDEEVVYTWVQEEDQAWRIIATDPAVPNFEEMLYNSRGSDNRQWKLRPGVDD